PGRLDRVEEVVARALAGLESDVVEDVELSLGSEEGDVADSGALQVGLGLPRDVARIATVRLVGKRVDDEEVNDERLVLTELVNEGSGRVSNELHVGLVDRLEAPDG